MPFLRAMKLTRTGMTTGSRPTISFNTPDNEIAFSPVNKAGNVVVMIAPLSQDLTKHCAGSPAGS